MTILVLDCAFKPTVAIIKDNKQLVCNVSENEKHSDNFMLLIDKSLKQENLTINDVDVIFVNKGPGSFTGLRVAVSIAKGLGFGDNIKFLAFTSFDYVGENKEVLVSAFSNFVYRRNVHGQMSCETLSDLDYSTNYVTANYDLYEKLKALSHNVCYQERIGYQEIFKTIDKKYLKINELEPLYLRKSQAELERDNKVGKK